MSMAVEPERDAPAEPAVEQTVDAGSDAALVREMIAGSHDALAALYDRHTGAVFAAAMRASHDRSIADEVVQETFLALWDRAELFDPSRGSLGAWLVTIARNRAIDHLRAGGRHRAATFGSFNQAGTDDHSLADWLTTAGELIGAAGPETAPEDALASKEVRASLREAVASLDPAERRVITLAYEAGLTQVEIATELGWPLGTVKTRTRRALHRLRDRLDAPPAVTRRVDRSPCVAPCL